MLHLIGLARLLNYSSLTSNGQKAFLPSRTGFVYPNFSEFVSSTTKNISNRNLLSSSSSHNDYKISKPQGTQRLVTLYLRKANEEEESNSAIEEKEKEQERPVYVEDPRLLACDLLAILLACQLIGLSDVFLSSSFWNHGGFVQPVTVSSFSTLPILMKRDSLLSICWITSSLYNKAYSHSALTDDVSVVKSVFSIFTDFCSLMIISSLLMAISSHAMVDTFELLRELWFAVLVVGTLRFAYSRTIF